MRRVMLCRPVPPHAHAGLADRLAAFAKDPKVLLPVVLLAITFRISRICLRFRKAYAEVMVELDPWGQYKVFLPAISLG